MAVVIQAGYTVDNTQKKTIVNGTLKITDTTYPVGGPALDSVLLALPEVTTNSGVRRCLCTSLTGTGYVYQRIAATGKLMILQVPVNGSLTTAAPLNQIPSSTNMNGINNDVIDFEAEFLRNA